MSGNPEILIHPEMKSRLKNSNFELISCTFYLNSRVLSLIKVL